MCNIELGLAIIGMSVSASVLGVGLFALSQRNKAKLKKEAELR